MVVLLAGMAGGKYRSFLVHIKAAAERVPEESPRRLVRMPATKPAGGSKVHTLSTLLQKAQATKVELPHLHAPEVCGHGFESSTTD